MSAVPHTDEKRRPSDDFKSSDTLIGTAKTHHRAAAAVEASTLRYRHRALWLLAFYTPLLVIPWALSCVLVYHPIDGSSYYDQSGFPKGSLKLHRRLINALAVLNSVAGIVTIPLISALIAQAAVVYTQRRRNSTSLSIRQTFALADRGWSNLGVLQEAWPPWGSRSNSRGGASSHFLWLSAMFLLLCAVQQPFREGFMSNEPTLVMTSDDNPLLSTSSGFQLTHRLLGFDPEPYDLATIPEDIVVQDVMGSLADLNRYEIPTNLWPDFGGEVPLRVDFSTSITSSMLGPWMRPSSDYFVSALLNGSTTGVLRHRAMRLNSTVLCREIAQSEFPSQCSGEGPFSASFTRGEQLAVRVCLPGRRGFYPWQLTRNRQSIAEDMYIDVAVVNSNISSFTRRCTARTTRGYFELGNYRNGFMHGNLMERFEEPDRYAKNSKYNDWLSIYWRDGNEFSQYTRWFKGRWRRPSAEDKLTDIPKWPEPQFLQEAWPTIPGSSNPNRTMSGPLMTAIVAMFGERSLLAAVNSSSNATSAFSQLCQSGRLPFATFDNYRSHGRACANTTDAAADDAITSIMTNFMNLTFNRSESSRESRDQHLEASVFLANRAMLLRTVQNTQEFTARTIRTAPGTYIQRPTITTAGMIVVSILVLFQLIGLAYLVWYIYQVPTWTAMLDALAIARITNSLDKGDIPAIGSLTEKDLRRLGELNGSVGIVEGDSMDDMEDPAVRRELELGLGASGVFHRRLAKFRMTRSQGSPGLRGGEMEMDCQCEGCRRRRAVAESSSAASSFQ
ncbi:hypothetical protein FB567DRAFT_263880 [Paraphoma chrysanthemicola]|uniref:Uncharacterized protein n=1 Tax=Paraphoma chrysanthemicola TaxID=798071 RepID=A0A8K0RBC6_9PLEO|nr:hypothetical protein FB567DRAFT_263880 [Paraphoma chrysanthemicola]